MTPEWTPPRSKEELDAATAAFDQECRELKGAMSEDMFDRVKILSMMERLYRLGFREDHDFSSMKAERLCMLVDIVSHQVASLRILEEGGNEDLASAYWQFAAGNSPQ